jgi:hypothetical protein
MTPVSIIEITLTRTAFGLGFTFDSEWGNIVFYLTFISICFNYRQKKIKDNKYIDFIYQK